MQGKRLIEQKAPNKLGIEGNFLELIKDRYEKLTSNFILKTFPPKIMNKIRLYPLATSIPHCTRNYTQRN